MAIIPNKKDDPISLLKEEEVIKILNENGIQVIYKPVALIPEYTESYDGFHPIGYVETDIYKALHRLENRIKTTKDPFS